MTPTRTERIMLHAIIFGAFLLAGVAAGLAFLAILAAT